MYLRARHTVVGVEGGGGGWGRKPPLPGRASGRSALDRELFARSHRVRSREAAHAIQEVAQHVRPLLREVDLGVELHAVVLALGEFDGRDDVARARNNAPTRRQLVERVAVGEEYWRPRAHALEERTVGLHLHLKLAILAPRLPSDRAPVSAAQELHAVADAEDGHAERENRGVVPRCICVVHRLWPTGDDHRCVLCQLIRRRVEREQVALDRQLPHTTVDHLAVLGTRVENHHSLCHFSGAWCGREELYNTLHFSLLGLASRILNRAFLATSTMTASARVAELHDFFMYEYKCSMCDGTHEYSTFCKECVRAHTLLELRRDPRLHSYKQGKCLYFDSAQGCLRGVECPFSHTTNEARYHPVAYKTKMCERIATSGACGLGDLCHLAHGVEELRREAVYPNTPALLPESQRAKHIDGPFSRKAHQGGHRAAAAVRAPEPPSSAAPRPAAAAAVAAPLLAAPPASSSPPAVATDTGDAAAPSGPTSGGSGGPSSPSPRRHPLTYTWQLGAQPSSSSAWRGSRAERLHRVGEYVRAGVSWRQETLHQRPGQMASQPQSSLHSQSV